MNFGEILRNALALVVVLGTLIFLHEGGHFLVAKLLRFPVAVFSIGFGKRLWGFRIRETDYRISAIPLGGYVRVVGLGPDEGLLTDDETDPILKDAIAAAPDASRWKRIAIFSAGPIANALVALVLLTVAYMLGREVPAYLDQPVVVGWVEPGSAAEVAGLRVGDRVVSIEGRAVPTWDGYQMEVMPSIGRNLVFRYVPKGGHEEREVTIPVKRSDAAEFGETGLVPHFEIRVTRVSPGMPAEEGGVLPGDVILGVEDTPVTPEHDVASLVGKRGGQPTRFRIRRDGAVREIVLVPKESGGRALVGIELRPDQTTVRRLPLAEAFRESVAVNVDMTKKTLDVVGRLFRARASMRQMSGPLEIARFAGQESKGGVSAFLSFMAMVSLQLFIFNALPIPLLDGFHIVLVAVEGLLRRDLSLGIKERIFQVGFVLLVSLMLVVLFFDVAKTAPVKKIFGG